MIRKVIFALSIVLLFGALETRQVQDIEMFMFNLTQSKQMLNATHYDGWLNSTYPKQIQNIDAITQAYLTAEKYLWQLIYSTDKYNRMETFAYIYDTHEEHLGKNFGEKGRLERMARMYPSRRGADHHRRTSTWKVIDAIEEINATALNTYRILAHHNYDPLPRLMEDIAENVPKKMASIRRHADTEFWIAAKNVSSSRSWP